MRGKFHRPQNRSAITEYTEKGLPKLCRKTQQNLESPLFQAFFSTYVPEKAFSVCIKVSVFIEPACGDGTFLAEILRRKLAVVQRKYGGARMHHDYEMWSMNIYGVELLPDNAAACRERLFNMRNEAYSANCKGDADDECRDAVRYILERNILCGDALSMKQKNGEPIIFADWSFVTGTKVKRRDFRLDQMLEGHQEQMSLFMDGWEYDEEIDAFIPLPLKEYPITDYRRVQYHG